MKIGLRKPSLKGRLSARTSIKRYLRHSVGIKAPRGFGIFTNPKKAIYNKVYNKTSFSIDSLFKNSKRRSSKSTNGATGVVILLVILIMLIEAYWYEILIGLAVVLSMAILFFLYKHFSKVEKDES